MSSKDEKRHWLSFGYIACLLIFLLAYHGVSAVASCAKHAPNVGNMICVALLLLAIYLHWKDRPHDF